jgi:hypothetical protein
MSHATSHVALLHCRYRYVHISLAPGFGALCHEKMPVSCVGFGVGVAAHPMWSVFVVCQREVH